MNRQSLAEAAECLVAPGKGILAADESVSTIGKRFAMVGVEATEENRRDYRSLLFTAPGLGDSISGIILHDETIRQRTRSGELLRDLIANQGIMVGIKVDEGLEPLSRFPEESVTRGLDGLRPRLREYREMGASFAKWRAVVRIGSGLPTLQCLRANAHLLARYALLCQDEGLVPIVEPEVLMDGDHALEQCEAVTCQTLRLVFDALTDFRVVLEEMLLKPNMVIPGKDCVRRASPDEVADATIRCLRRSVPAAVPGIVFLSGGQDEVTATRHLNLLNQAGKAPWPLSFSYGRALQESALATWRGEDANIPSAQTVLMRRARCNSAACLGRYINELEQS